MAQSAGSPPRSHLPSCGTTATVGEPGTTQASGPSQDRAGPPLPSAPPDGCVDEVLATPASLRGSVARKSTNQDGCLLQAADPHWGGLGTLSQRMSSAGSHGRSGGGRPGPRGCRPACKAQCTGHVLGGEKAAGGPGLEPPAARALRAVLPAVGAASGCPQSFNTA